MDTTSSTTAITQRMQHTGVALRGRQRRPLTRSLLFVMPVFGLLSALAAAPVEAAFIRPPVVPPEIAVPAGNRAFLLGNATGTQTYTCSSDGTSWGSAVPAAILFDHGFKIATHYAGPTWQAIDGSLVVGTKLASAPAPTDPNGNVIAIPWLLVGAVSTAPGPRGDTLVPTTYIQRVNTTGGLAPALPCTPGALAAIPYTADYYFFKARQ